MLNKKTNYFVYILRCSDGSLYTGMTNNLENRIQKHNLGLGAKYTKGRRPVDLIFQETQISRSSALKREIEIKKLSREQKLSLISELK